MSTENNESDEQAAFEAAFNATEPAPAPAPAAAPAEQASPAAGEANTEVQPAAEPSVPVDELAGLPASIRALVEDAESLRQVAKLVPGLADRLRKAEGRLGELNARVPVPPPPAPPRLEKVEAIRADLPEVADAIAEYVQHHMANPAPQEPAAQQQVAEDPPTPLLDDEMPDWQAKAGSAEFETWLNGQTPEYRQRVKTTNAEGVMFAALARFDAHQSAVQTQRQAAQRVTQTRQARVSAAAAPPAAARRTPIESDPEAEFEKGFYGR